MKKFLLATLVLTFAALAFGQGVNIFWQLNTTPGNILDYVNTPVPNAGDFGSDPDFILSIECDAFPGEVYSTSASLFGASPNVYQEDLGGGMMAWARCDSQIWSAPWPANSTITFTLQYLPNPDPLTNTVSNTVVYPGGFDPIFLLDMFGTTPGTWWVPPTVFETVVQPITYTVYMTTDPAGYISPAQVGPFENVEDTYGIYTPTDVSATGYWTPASLTIDANTVWVADGDNFRFDQEFVWTELDYNNYHLTLNVVDTYFNGAYDINGYAVQAGTPTPIDALMVPAADPNPIDVDYTIAAAPDGYYWMPSVTQNPEFEMLQTKASKGVADYGRDLTWTLMQAQVDNYYRVIVQVWNGTDYLGVYDFTGPLNGSTPYVSDPDMDYTIFLGTYTMESPAPAGWQWQFTVYNDLDAVGDFAQDPNNQNLWTAYVTFILIEDVQTPVELSSFTATLTGENFVQLAWTSQSENQMMGYRVYRNTSSDQTYSELIDVPMIPATNTSTTQNYSVVDTNVEIGQMYYYWLEAVDYNASNFHGPVSVTVTGNVPPVLPEVTSMRNAYPNPFKTNGNTTIEVSLKAGDTGTLTIYNVQGQVVKTVSLTEGSHTINWNGRDSRGNACGSGIYFYKLSTPSLNQTKKMVIVK